MSYSKKDFINEAEVYLLETGGVDNWDWYTDSLNDANFTRTGNEKIDNENWLAALDSGGVDNWVWYSESLQDLSEYIEYLEEFEKNNLIENALTYFMWSINKDIKTGVNENDSKDFKVEDHNYKGNSGVIVESLGNRLLREYVSEAINFGLFSVPTSKVFDLVKENIWKRNVFNKEFEKSLKFLVKGSGFEPAQEEYLRLLKENGKLDKYILKIFNEMS